LSIYTYYSGQDLEVNIRCQLRCGATGIAIYCWRECKTAHPFWKIIWWFLTKLNILLAYDPQVSFPDIDPKELEIYLYSKICTQVFIAALFISA
jgi:hypothetical protein